TSSAPQNPSSMFRRTSCLMPRSFRPARSDVKLGMITLQMPANVPRAHALVSDITQLTSVVRLDDREGAHVAPDTVSHRALVHACGDGDVLHRVPSGLEQSDLLVAAPSDTSGHEVR